MVQDEPAGHRPLRPENRPGLRDFAGGFVRSVAAELRYLPPKNGKFFKPWKPKAVEPMCPAGV